MASFKSIVVVGQPVEKTWSAIRDHMSEIACSLGDIQSVTVLQREDIDALTVRLVNEWRAGGLPRFALERCGTDYFGWIDDAFWRKGAWECSWSIEPNILKGNMRCSGRTLYQSAMNGRGTKAIFEGSLELDSPGIAQSLGLPGRAAISLVESVITTMIPRNFRKTVEAAASFIQKTALPASQ
jgi:hypothetical protein